MDRVVLRSPAKLNLYLEVLGKRPDGYHNIETVFERIDLCDRIVLAKRKRGIRLISKNKNLVTDGRNLAYKAARLLLEETGLAKRKGVSSRGVTIEIEKNIPISAGLGGGSSNAASVLLGLNKLYDLKLARKRLLGLAGKLGADVAFFVHGHPFAKGRSRGDLITPIRAGLRLWHILVMPPFGLSSRRIYTSLHSRMEERSRDAEGVVNALRNRRLTGLDNLLYNKLEEPVLAQCPRIRQVKENLFDAGVKRPLVSGSGPAVFGLTKTRKEAMDVKKKLMRKKFGGRKRWQVYIVRTM